MDIVTKLRPKQQRFVEEYLVDLNATQAAIRAGYSVKTAEQIGYKLIQKSSVSLALQEAFQARSERTQIDQDWVLQTLKRNIERAMQEHPVFDRKGESTGLYAYEGAVANKGLELIGEHLRMFGDRKQLNLNLAWRFTIGKGYDETDTDDPMVVDSVVSKELRES